MTALRAMALVVAALAAGACASAGTRFDPDSVGRIQLDRTTQSDARRIFGTPTHIHARGSGGTTWGYVYEETETRSTSTLARIGAFLATLMGRPAVFPPVAVSTSTTTRYSLTLYFDDAGVVRDYDYERSVIPRKQVH